MESSSVDETSSPITPDPARARDEQRRAAAREAERAAQLREENQRRAAAKVDPSRGTTIDTFS